MQVAKNVAHHLNLSHILNLMVTDSSTTFKTKRLGIDPKARLMQVLSLDEAKPIWLSSNCRNDRFIV